MKEKVYRIINIYGKQIFCKEHYEEVDVFDEYNLENSFYYIDKLDSDDARLKDYEIFNHVTLREDIYKEDRHEMLQQYLFDDNNVKNDEELLLKYMKRPLDVFYDDNVLNNRDVITKIIKEYLVLLYTLVKEKYRKYFSYVGIGSLLIMNKIYPLKNINETLIKEVLKSKQYKLDYITHLIVHSSLSIYYDARDDEYIIPKAEQEFLELIIPYIEFDFEDKQFIIDVINNTEDSDIYGLMCVLEEYACEEFNNDKDIKALLIAKEEQDELEGVKYKKTEEYIKYTKTLEISDFDSYIENLVYIFKDFRSVFYYRYEIINYIPTKLFENKLFLMKTARKGIGLSKYSNRFYTDIEIKYEEIKNGCIAPYDLKSELLNDPDYILKLREVCDKILFYVGESVLNNYEFIINYIKRYSTDKYFILGKELSKNKDFFYEAVLYDPYILFYCSYELRENPFFMYTIISKNDNCIIFLGDKLKNDIHFINTISGKIRVI